MSTTPNAARPDVPAGPTTEQILVQERARVTGIRDTVRALRLPDAFAATHEDSGTALADFRALAIDEAARADTAAGPTSGAGGDQRTWAQPANYVPGTNAARFIMAVAAAGRSGAREASDWAARTWGPQGQIIARALSSSIGSAGGFTIPADQYGELIEFLRPASAVMSLGPRIIPMPHGNVSVPRLDTGSTASYVGELATAGETNPVFGEIQLSARKLNAYIPISKDMIRFPSMDIETQVRDDLVAAIAQRADLAFLLGDGTGNTPKGIDLQIRGNASVITLNNLAVTAAGGSETQAATVNRVRQDLGRLVTALLNQNIKLRKPGWIMHPRTSQYLLYLADGLGGRPFGEEMDKGTLLGFPFRTTTQIPTNLTRNSGTNESLIQFADFAEFYIGEAQELEVSVYDQFTYVDANGNTINLARMDMIAIMAQVQHDCALRQKWAAAQLYGVGGTAGFWQ